jgi:hypothetical protein
MDMKRCDVMPCHVCKGRLCLHPCSSISLQVQTGYDDTINISAAKMRMILIPSPSPHTHPPFLRAIGEKELLEARVGELGTLILSMEGAARAQSQRVNRYGY